MLRSARKKRAAVAARTADMAFPKPVSPDGSSHRRRDRELGRMLYLHETQACDVLAAYVQEFGAPRAAAAELLGACDGPGEVMHLGEREGYRAPDRQTAKGCKKHHTDIDGKVGGHGVWFVCLGKERQVRLEVCLVARADTLWFGLAQEVRADYDRRAEEQRRRRVRKD